MALDNITTARLEITKIYIAAFNRAPDAAGLSNWINQYNAGLMTYKQISEDFSNQPEYIAKYPSAMTSTEYITNIYLNVFGRTPDAGGLENWLNHLDNPTITGATRGNIMKTMLESASAAGNTDGIRLTNQATFAVKAVVTDGIAESIATAQLANITSDPATVDTATTAVSGSVNAGQSYTLTAGLDNLIGDEDNNTFNSSVDTTAGSSLNTLSAIDTIDGSGGTDTLKISAVTALTTANLPTLSNVETISISAASTVGATGAAAAFNTTAITGLTTLTVTKATDAFVNAAATTNVNVTASGDIEAWNGKDVSITNGAAAKTITVGDATATTGNPAGKVTVTDTDNTGANAITITGGTDVTVATTADKATSASITVGHATNGQASGAVAVTQNSTSNGTAMTAGNVTVTGGTTIDITANMTNTAVKGGAANAITAGTYTANAGNTTTAVTVKQVATATDFANDASTGTMETAVVTFGALKAGEAVLVGETGGSTAGTELTFVAEKDLTAAEVAAAFANLTNADIQACGGKTANGIYSGALDAGWTAGAVSGASVTFTATTVGNKTNLDVRTDANGAGAADDGATADTDFAAVVTAGTAAAASTAVDVTADFGAVVVDDNGTESITTITLDGYDTADLGTNTALGALTTVSLSNSAGANVIDNGATAAALTLNLDKITGTTDIDNGAASVTDLIINTSGSASSSNLTATTVKNLTINAAANFTNTTALGAVEVFTVTGAGNVTIGDISAKTTTVSAGTATGNISATIDGTKATVTTGSGNDTITTDTSAITKNINLGNGADTLVMNAGDTTAPTSTVTGGDGIDTISMTSASAIAFDNSTGFASAITSFERLVLSDRIDVEGDVTIDMENLGFSYVTLSGGLDDSGATAETLILDKLANNGTVVLNNTMDATAAQSDLQVNVKDAATTDATLNIIVQTNTANALDVGAVTAAEVETIKITADDLNTDEDADGIVGEANEIDTATLAVVANKATSVVIDGDSNLTLSTTAALLTSVDASALTGVLAYTAGVASSTLKGGTAADTLTAGASSVTVYGNAGADTISVTDNMDLVKLYGGEGADKFDFNGAASNKDSYAVIKDIATGDKIDIKGVDANNGGTVDITDFNATAITLAEGATESSQAYLNQAIKTLAQGESGWFQYGGNTFIVADISNNANSYVDGTDFAVMLTGTFDLSAASFNATSDIIEIC